jgi:hypothetical protein
MGKFLLVGVAVVIGYSFGFRDARKHSENILVRAVDKISTAFGATPTNDIDAVMTKVEGKN